MPSNAILASVILAAPSTRKGHPSFTVVCVAMLHLVTGAGPAQGQSAAPPGPPATPSLSPEAAADVVGTADTREEETATTGGGEVILMEEKAPAKEGTIGLDGEAARSAPGAMGEPLRALALLPGVITSAAAVGYPVIRGTLPGESRFTFDGIELPLLYHLFLGNQVIHPAFVGSIELRAGGYGADHGHLLGGLVTVAAPGIRQHPHTEVRANLVELGVFHSRQISDETSLAAAVRVGTLSLAAKLVSSKASLQYVDQQTRITHRLHNGDELTVTSLGAFDYIRTPPEQEDGDFSTLRLGFHRLETRWERARHNWRVRAGAQSELDILRVDDRVTEFDTKQVSTKRAGASAIGARPYVDVAIGAARWLDLRGGLQGRHRRLFQRGEQLFDSERAYLQPAQTTTTAGAWLVADARVGKFQISPGIRSDVFSAQLRIPPPISQPMVPAMNLSPSHVTFDPRLNITAKLPRGVLAELSGGGYSAPPQASLFDSGLVIGPLPVTDGIGSIAGISKSRQIQAAVRGPIAADFDGSVAIYARNTRYAVDFAMIDKDFAEGTRPACLRQLDDYQERIYDRNIDTNAKGVEIMVRRDLRQRLSGWVSYSLAKIDRRLPIGTQPHDFDQRHTLNAAVQYRLGRWTLGTTIHMHTGRAAQYPALTTCPIDEDDTYTDVRADPANLRRLPTTYRADVRIERAFRFSSWNLRLTLEVINAALRDEVLGYEYNYLTEQVQPQTFALPVPMIGLEAEL